MIVTSAGEEAGGIAIAAATLFGLFGADREQFQEADFWDEHSLDEQRFFNILCWVFGSDPATYGDAVAESVSARIGSCVARANGISSRPPGRLCSLRT